jgi:predicted glycoside hydrolase/deacetylase ChbG (UPF0249 family)
MKMLIVNADDFGLTSGVNTGIVTAHQEGIVTSATIMATGAAFEHAARLASENSRLGVGVHLVAVGGTAIAPPHEIKSLADADGRLPATLTQLALKLIRGAVEVTDVEREFRAQLELVKRAGITPTHLDTHKHAHTQPRVMEAPGRVASDYGIRWVRNPFESFAAGAIRGGAVRQRRLAHWKQRFLAAAQQIRLINYRELN